MYTFVSPQAELLKAFKEEVSPKYFGWFERALKENGSGFMIGSAVSCVFFL